MNIVQVSRQKESKLQRHLASLQDAIAALNGAGKIVKTPIGRGKRPDISAAGRARIARAMKARWAKIRAEKAKKAK